MEFSCRTLIFTLQDPGVQENTFWGNTALHGGPSFLGTNEQRAVEARKIQLQIGNVFSSKWNKIFLNCVTVFISGAAQI
jgi:hypothetical protein